MLLYRSGNRREIKLPAKCGELMIQELGHVISPVDEIRRTGRVSALLADEELVAGKVYLLLPVNRVRCKASKMEMGIAEKHSVSAQTKKTKGNQMPKVSPSLISRSSQRLGQNEVTVFPIKKVNQFQTRWNPLLDPISESPSPLHQFGPQF
uniref:DUF4228 domain-containing protein n=2 Tax=Cajanus cajan TaxID=3821 RepID=A0A151RYD7_CAJCA|nr:hypothetical protein KK1_030761 [Cajanus cajan]